MIIDGVMWLADHWLTVYLWGIAGLYLPIFYGISRGDTKHGTEDVWAMMGVSAILGALWPVAIVGGVLALPTVGLFYGMKWLANTGKGGRKGSEIAA